MVSGCILRLPSFRALGVQGFRGFGYWVLGLPYRNFSAQLSRVPGLKV